MGDLLHVPDTREALERWLKAPPPPAKRPIVMLLLGRSAQVEAFSQHALGAAQRAEFREAVWVKKAGVFTPEELTRYFQGDADCLAVVLDARGTPRAWVRQGNTGNRAAENAYLDAEGAVLE